MTSPPGQRCGQVQLFPLGILSERRQLAEELRHIATEPSPSEVMKALEQDGLLPLFSPALAGAKLNLAGLAKLEKARRLLPQEAVTAAAKSAAVNAVVLSGTFGPGAAVKVMP